MSSAPSFASALVANDPVSLALAGYGGATPELLGRRELLSRIDSKFVVPAHRMDRILLDLADHYAVLRVPTGNVATYQSLYFDTPALRCFHDHRRGKRVRHKVRIRHYPDREVSFLEVKTKRNETVTDKHRLAIPFGSVALGAAERDFLRSRVGAMVDELQPQLWINYRRISLIGLHTSERVTIDVDLTVDGHAQVSDWFGRVGVVEVKQSPFCVRTPIMRALIGAGLRERSLSKYVVAVALSRPEQRRNRLMPDLRALERI
jgi:hypothetical protein